MGRPPVMALVIMILVGVSGCAGTPQRFSWFSPSVPGAEGSPSPATAHSAWWHRAGSQHADAAPPDADLAESSQVRSQPEGKRSPLDIWPERRSDRLARFFPSLSRRWNAAEKRVADERSAKKTNSTRGSGLVASRPVTRFRDVAPEPEKGPDKSPDGVAPLPLANARGVNEGEVLRASLPPQERPALVFTQGVLQPQSPLFQARPDAPNASTPVPTSRPAPAPTLIALSSSEEPENLLPRSLMRDQEGPADPPEVTAPIQDQAPASKPSEKSAAAQKPSAKPLNPPPPPRRPPAAPRPTNRPSDAKKSAAPTKPAADEMKLQSPELEPAPAIQPPSPARVTRPEAQKGVNATPSPPLVPTAGPEPTAPTGTPPAASPTRTGTSTAQPPAPGTQPATSGAAPAAPSAESGKSVQAPAASGSAAAGYAPSSGSAEYPGLPSFDGAIKSLPSAQLPPPTFPASYNWSFPAAPRVLPSPQSSCAAWTTQKKKCNWQPGKCTLLLCRKLKCLKQFIHEHCPFKKKASNMCCQNCPCCNPISIGAMPSAQWFFAPFPSAPASVPVITNPATPQVSGSSSSVERYGEEAGRESLSAVDPSTGTKPGDVTQGGEELKPVAPNGLDETP